MERWLQKIDAANIQRIKNLVDVGKKKVARCNIGACRPTCKLNLINNCSRKNYSN